MATGDKKYSNMFLRVGNVQKSRQILDAFFFWLLPHLVDVNSILSESWSISSIALNSARLLERYHLLLGNEGYRCHVDMLSSYHDRRTAVMAETKDALHRFTNRNLTTGSLDPAARTLVVISAVSTGNSLGMLKKTIEEYDSLSSFRFVALYRLTTNCEIDMLCDLSDGIRGIRFDVDCRPQAGHDAVVEIDREAYFPLQTVDVHRILLRKKHAEKSKKFFSTYKGSRAITIHKDATDQNAQYVRHHAIYVDVSVLSKLKPFRQKLSEELKRLPVPPTVVVAPPHSAPGSLVACVVELLQQRFKGIPVPEIVNRPNLSDPDIEARLTRMNENDLILIVDDVCINGWRLKQYQKALRACQSKARVAYLVGVARPTSEDDWISLSKELVHRPSQNTLPHLVLAPETVVLPNWHEDECPWCQEAHVLNELQKKPDAPIETRRAIVDRIHKLNRAKLSSGLFEDAIWTLSDRARLKFLLAPSAIVS